MFNIPKLVRKFINKLLSHYIQEMNCENESIDIMIKKYNNEVLKIYLYKDKKFVKELTDNEIETILN